MPWGPERGWPRQAVQGATIRDADLASLLVAQVTDDARHHEAAAEWGPRFTLLDGDQRRFVESRSVRREGQGTFRARLLDAYGRCAITGERTQPVLDAAHIQPYLGPRSNHVQNGLLLTKEFHKLFDEGFVTVTPDLEVKVSGALRDRWSNGRRYYEYDGHRLAVIPAEPAAHPSKDALDWHAQNWFRG
jgi:putative restriction endonuclease